jgi:hypothetical protein
MKINWSSVKTQTLWGYEDLLGRLQSTLAYNFVQEYYNHTMEQARSYARRIRSGYLQDRRDKTAYVDNMVANLEKLEAQRIGTYSELVHRVSTRELCIAFLERTDFSFDQLIQTLNYLFRWVLPFKTPVREYLDTDREMETKHLEALKKQRLASTLDLLEAGRFRAGRVHLSRATGIPVAIVTALVHRADISRLAYVRGKTVMHLCAGGYDTLEKLAAANLAEMEEKMEAHYRTLGKGSADFRSVIPLSWMVGGAKILPIVVKS